MSAMEIVIRAMGDASTIEEIEENDPQGFEQNQEAAVKGGETAGKMREAYEDETGRKVITAKSSLRDQRLPPSSSTDEEKPSKE